MRRLLFVLAWVGVLTAITLSLVPIAFRPHVFETSQIEHVDAYFLIGAAFALALPAPRGKLIAAVALSLLAAALEVLQLWVPGRHARLVDWAAGSVGAWLGISAVVALVWATKAIRRAL
jgi:VanZ family protein